MGIPWLLFDYFTIIISCISKFNCLTMSAFNYAREISEEFLGEDFFKWNIFSNFHMREQYCLCWAAVVNGWTKMIFESMLSFKHASCHHTICLNIFRNVITNSCYVTFFAWQMAARNKGWSVLWVLPFFYGEARIVSFSQEKSHWKASSPVLLHSTWCLFCKYQLEWYILCHLEITLECE